MNPSGLRGPIHTLVAAALLAATSAASATVVIDFDTLSPGDIVDNQFAPLGVTVTTNDPTNHPAMIFNSSAPTGGDADLGSPNADFGGPGVGNGGKSGQPGANANALGNVLIISEDGDSGDPDDNAAGGTIIFDFDAPVVLVGLEFLDIDNDEPAGMVEAFDAASNQILMQPIAALGNNSYQSLDFSLAGMSRLEVHFPSSGALASIAFTRVPEPSSLLLIALGVGVAATSRRRRRG